MGMLRGARRGAGCARANLSSVNLAACQLVGLVVGSVATIICDGWVSQLILTQRGSLVFAQVDHALGQVELYGSLMRWPPLSLPISHLSSGESPLIILGEGASPPTGNPCPRR